MALSEDDSAVSLKSVLLMCYSIPGDRPTGRNQFTKKRWQLLTRDRPRVISWSIYVKFQPKRIVRCADSRDCNSLWGYAHSAASPCAHEPLAESIQVRDSVSSHLEISNIHLKKEVPPIRINLNR